MSKTNISTRYAQIIIMALVAILLFLCGLFVRQYRRIEQQNYANSYEDTIDSSPYRDSLTARDVGVVLPWMTFRYINTIFGLPANYLKDTLHVTSTRYPNLSLSAYAKSQKMDTGIFISTLQKAVSDYLTSKSKS
jgi:hypothetical protein